MPNSVPYEIVGLPADVYLADVGTTFPDIDATPDPGDWTLLGQDGSLNYTVDGVIMNAPQSFNFWRSLGSAAVRKVFRTEEDFRIGVSVADMTLEVLALVAGNTVQPVTAQPGTADHKRLGGTRGLTIATFAVLVRVPGGSPYMADGNFDIRLGRAQYTGSGQTSWRRDGPAIVPMEFTALVDPDAADPSEQLVTYLAQTGASAST